MALNTNYQEVDINLNRQVPVNQLRGRIPNYNSVSIRTQRVLLNPSSTQDFFASGEFLKKVSITNGVMVVDLVDAIDDDVIGVLETSDPLIQKEKTATGAVVKQYDKGNYINLPTMFNGSVEINVEAAEEIEIGEAVEIATTGDQVQVLTTGTKIGYAVTNASQAGDNIIVVLQKF